MGLFWPSSEEINLALRKNYQALDHKIKSLDKKIKKLEESLEMLAWDVVITLKNPNNIGVKSILKEKTGVGFSVFQVGKRLIYVQEPKHIGFGVGFTEVLKEDFALEVYSNQKEISFSLVKKTSKDRKHGDIFASYDTLISGTFPFREFLKTWDSKKNKTIFSDFKPKRYEGDRSNWFHYENEFFSISFYKKPEEFTLVEDEED